jgi:hypothetical protein
VAGAESNLLLPPATYYGAILPGAGVTPTVGAPVQAWIGDNQCGEGMTRQVDGQIVYVVTVYAAGAEGALPCGAAGQTVRFTASIAGVVQTLAPQVVWDNRQVQALNLTVAEP